MKEKTIKNLVKIATVIITCIAGSFFVNYLILKNFGELAIKTTKPYITGTIFPYLMGILITAIVAVIMERLAVKATDKISFFLFKKHEIKIIEKGRKDWFDWFTRHNELSPQGQIKLVELASKDEKHLNMLMEYTDELCPEAASLFVNTLFNHLEDYLINGYYQGNILSILVNGSKENQKYSELLRNYVKRNNRGYVYLSHKNFIEKLIENGEIEILIGYCKKEEYIKPEDEVRLVKQATKEPRFKEVIVEYLDAIKNSNCRYYRTENSVCCSDEHGMWKNNISEEAEKEMAENSSYDTINVYCKYVENLRYTTQSILAKRYQKEKDEGIRDILLRQKLLCNDALSIIIHDN